MTYPNAIFSAFALTGFLLCVIPYPWHLTSWNTGACLYMVWTGLGCLNQFINSVVWNHNLINRSPIWCDISSKFIIGNSVAIPTASLCICRRLYLISSLKSFTISKAETRRNIMVDLSIGLGLPVLVMTLHYIVQGHRFNIFEDVGCGPSTYYTWPAYVLVSAPPIVIGLVSAAYAVLNIKQFYKIHNRIKAEHPDNGITPSMYVRFMCLASTEILCTVPLASFFLIWNASDLSFRFPWISWADTHSNFSRVELYPATMWRSDPSIEHTIELNRWLNVMCAFVFFAFFGYTAETKKMYGRIFQAIAKRVGFQPTRKINQLPPIHFNSPVDTSHDSFGSFTDATISNHNLDSHLVEKQGPDKGSAIVLSSPDIIFTTPQPDGVRGMPVTDDRDTPVVAQESFLLTSSLCTIPAPQPARIRQGSIIYANPLSFDTVELPPKSHMHDIV